MTRIVADCPEQEGCMFLRCGTPCHYPKRRPAWIVAYADVWVRCEKANACGNKCQHAVSHFPVQITATDKVMICVEPYKCEYLRQYRGLTGKERECKCIETSEDVDKYR